MRPLGFWNRLAIVASVIAVIVVPAWVYIDTVGSINTSKALLLESCRNQAMVHQLPNGLADFDKIRAADKLCWDDFARRPEPDGTIWQEAFAATALLCAFIYGLIWTIVAAAKWVWRGRSAKST